MSNKSLENYARLAEREDANHTEVAGRYSFQASAERHIIRDVAEKLALDGDDSLLEIGCGPGNLLLPLSYMVASATGIDNGSALARLAARSGGNVHLTLLAGDFLSMNLPQTRFSKILVYSVVQYVDSEASALRFLDRALTLLKSGGRLLLGDLPNTDKKRRFVQSPAGQRLSAEWSERVAGAGAHPISSLPADERLLTVDDALVLKLLSHGRARGFETYLLEQSPLLPFGNTREDLLFVSGS
jgi:ubiquinone/menaquinone biosynthesis C-methylase UbiE